MGEKKTKGEIGGERGEGKMEDTCFVNPLHFGFEVREKKKFEKKKK